MPHLMLARPVWGHCRHVWLPIVLAVASLALAGHAAASTRTVAHQASASIRHAHVFHIQPGADFAAVHWPGARDARVTVSFGRDVRHLGRPRRVLLDEVGDGAGGRETYGQLVAVRGARVLRVTMNRPSRHVTVLALDDRGGALPLRRVA